MAAHFTRQQRAGLFHLGLDQRMTGFPHHRFATFLPNSLGKITAALDIKNDLRAGIAGKYIRGIQHHQPVRPDDAAIRTHHSKPIAITIKGEPHISTGTAHHFY